MARLVSSPVSTGEVFKKKVYNEAEIIKQAITICIIKSKI
jgi:hypothetical protein